MQLFIVCVCNIYCVNTYIWEGHGSSFEAFGCSTDGIETCCIGEAMLTHAVALSSAWIFLCNRRDLPQIYRGEQRHHAVTLEPAFSCRQGTTALRLWVSLGWGSHIDKSNQVYSLHMFLLLWLHGLCHKERERLQCCEAPTVREWDKDRGRKSRSCWNCQGACNFDHAGMEALLALRQEQLQAHWQLFGEAEGWIHANIV